MSMEELRYQHHGNSLSQSNANLVYHSKLRALPNEMHMIKKRQYIHCLLFVVLGFCLRKTSKINSTLNRTQKKKNRDSVETIVQWILHMHSTKEYLFFICYFFLLFGVCTFLFWKSSHYCCYRSLLPRTASFLLLCFLLPLFGLVV